MAQTFGVGRPSIREALRLLEAQGLVTIRPGQGGGPVVGSPGGTAFGQTLSLYLQMKGRPLREVLESTVMLGGMIARAAAERIGAGYQPEDLDELMAASKQQGVKGQSDEEFLWSGIRFHALISDIAGNFTLQLFNDALSYIYAVTASESHGGHWADKDKELSSRDHVELAKAIKRGAGQRAAAIQEAHMRREIEFIDREGPGLLDKTVEWS
jgi:DNA-binding FadR family transcriptional regulator